MYRSGDRAGTLLYAALGAGMMGVWSTTLFGSGGMIQWQRWQGTLELGVGAPPSMTLVYLPFSLANSFTGMYALAATLIWGRRPLRRPAPLRPPVAVSPRAAGDGDRARADGARARVDVHPLPLRERALEPARVPGLDRVGARLLDVDAPGLDAADLVAAAARTGASSRSAMRRSAGTCGCRSRWSLALGLASFAIATVTFGSSSTWPVPARRSR